jgi:putative Mn2+ efflux pump MntP
MPVIGWLVGQTVVTLVSNYDHWVAFGLLVIVSGRLFWEFFQKEKEKEIDISRGWALVTVAIATSIDALAVGLSFALLKFNIFISAGIIGVVAFGITGFGFWFGRKVSILLGRWAKLFGAIVLLAIGIRILLSHLLQ